MGRHTIYALVPGVQTCAPPIFPRVANTCATCHVASYRKRPDENPTFVVGGPNHTLNLAAFFRFLVDCAKDPRFNADNIMHEINLVTELSWLDKLLYLRADPDHQAAADGTRGAVRMDLPHRRPRLGPRPRRRHEPDQVLHADRKSVGEGKGGAVREEP